MIVVSRNAWGVIEINLNQEGGATSMMQEQRKGKGFASMDQKRLREIASKGGKIAHERGLAHEFDSEEAREAGRKRSRR